MSTVQWPSTPTTSITTSSDFLTAQAVESIARDFYKYLTANFRAEGEEVLHRYVADAAMILDQIMTGTVIGSMLGLPGNGRRISFRTLHVFEFRNGVIGGENVCRDSGAIIAQRTLPSVRGT